MKNVHRIKTEVLCPAVLITRCRMAPSETLDKIRTLAWRDLRPTSWPTLLRLTAFSMLREANWSHRYFHLNCFTCWRESELSCILKQFAFPFASVACVSSLHVANILLFLLLSIQKFRNCALLGRSGTPFADSPCPVLLRNKAFTLTRL